MFWKRCTTNPRKFRKARLWHCDAALTQTKCSTGWCGYTSNNSIAAPVCCRACSQHGARANRTRRLPKASIDCDAAVLGAAGSCPWCEIPGTCATSRGSLAVVTAHKGFAMLDASRRMCNASIKDEWRARNWCRLMSRCGSMSARAFVQDPGARSATKDKPATILRRRASCQGGSPDLEQHPQAELDSRLQQCAP